MEQENEIRTTLIGWEEKVESLAYFVQIGPVIRAERKVCVRW